MQQNSNKSLLTTWLSIAGPCNMRELKGVLTCALLCRVHAASLQRELVINVIRYIARNSMHDTHAKQLEPYSDHFDAALAATWLSQKSSATAKTMTLWWSFHESAAAVVVDVDLFDHVISNMESQSTTAVQSVLGRKLFGGLFSLIQSHQGSEVATKHDVQKLEGARLTMASMNTFLAETTSAIVSALDLSSLLVRRVFTAQYRGCENQAGEDGALRARASHLPRDQSLVRSTRGHGASRVRGRSL